MKITKNNKPLAVGTVVVLPDEEILVIKEICKEPDDVYYRVQFVESDGDDYMCVGGLREMGHRELVGAEI